jgi:hypothetical protein
MFLDLMLLMLTTHEVQTIYSLIGRKGRRWHWGNLTIALMISRGIYSEMGRKVEEGSEAETPVNKLESEL